MLLRHRWPRVRVAAWNVRDWPYQLLFTPTASSLAPSVARVICGSGRGGGPCKTEPSLTEKNPWWQGHSSRSSFAEKYTANSRCVHFRLAATYSAWHVL